MTAPQDARGLFLLSTANLRLGDFAGADEVARKLLAHRSDQHPGPAGALHVARRAPRVSQGRRSADAVRRRTSTRAQGPRKRRGAAPVAARARPLAVGRARPGDRVLTTAIARRSDERAGAQLARLHARRSRSAAAGGDRLHRARVEGRSRTTRRTSTASAGRSSSRAGSTKPSRSLRKAAEALPDQSVIQDHFGDVLARRGKYRKRSAPGSAR